MLGRRNTNGQTDAPTGRYTAIDSAGALSCALSEAGSVVCWGSYVDGTAAEAPSDTYTAIAVAVWGACALRTGGEAACWGVQTYGNAIDDPHRIVTPPSL